MLGTYVKNQGKLLGAEATGKAKPEVNYDSMTFTGQLPGSSSDFVEYEVSLDSHIVCDRLLFRFPRGCIYSGPCQFSAESTLN